MDKISLKKGDLFKIKVNEIRRLSLSKDSSVDYNLKLISKNCYYGKLKNQYIICMYLGDGLARERSTSIIFNLVDIDKKCIFDSTSDYNEFEKKYNRALRYPLIVIYNEEDIYPVDFNYNFININNKYESEIKLNLKSQLKNAKRELINELYGLKAVESNETLTLNLKKDN